MLRCAHLPDGGFGPVVLVWGRAEDIRQLGVLLRSLSVSPREERIGADSSRKVELRITDGERGMQAVDGALTWEMAPADAARFSAMLGSLAASPFPAHQYLDCASGRGITVKVSLDEYPGHFRP